MAKAKNPAEATAAAKKPAAKEPAAKPVRKPPAKAAAKKTTKHPAAPAVPLIDTSLAAEAAAKMIARREFFGAGTAAPEGEKRESSTFKQLKEGLNKPAAQGPANFLHSTTPQKKLNLPFGGRNQVGHNQTFGADVNRAGVPRRTGG